MCCIMNKNKSKCRSIWFFVVLLLVIVGAAAFSTDNHGVTNDERRHTIQSSRILTLIDEAEALPPLFPFRWQDYLGYGVAILGLLLAAGGGIGGGGILVPTYILILEYPVKHAISFASVTVFGGAIANNLLNAQKKHPNHSKRSVIDWELILQLEPMAILGAIIGALLKDFLPDLMLIIMMLLLLTVTAYETLIKANKLHQKENEEESPQTTAGIGESKPLIDALSRTITIDISEIEEHDENDSSRAAVFSAAKLTSLFTIITILNLLSGGRGESGHGPGHFDACGAKCFWTTLVAMILVLLIFALHQRRDLLSKIERGVFVCSDIIWTEKNTISYPCYAILAGLVAGLFGVGGGIILGPLMLALGVHPAVASATCACMVLFTSSTATVTYMAHGLLVPNYAVFSLLLGFISTILGQKVMSVLLKRYKRHSYIAYSIGMVVALSAVAMAIQSVVAIRSNREGA
jgi:uncharacterized membrane protein YfcA